MSNQALARITRNEMSILPTSDTLESMLRMAGELHKSGLLPSHIKSPQAAFAVIQKGLELGVPPMYSMSNIIVINGKPSANAELMLALIYRDQGDNAIIFDESTDKRCTVSYKRKGWTQAKQFSFTIEEAKTAGLLSNQNWQKYPKAMLRARCISAVARLAFPDSIGGMYTPEELGANVAVSDDEEITVIEPEQTPTVREFPQQPVIEAEVAPPTATIAETTIQSIRSLAQRKGVDVDNLLASKGKPTLGFLTVEEADKLTSWLDTKPDIASHVSQTQMRIRELWNQLKLNTQQGVKDFYTYIESRQLQFDHDITDESGIPDSLGNSYANSLADRAAVKDDPLI